MSTELTIFDWLDVFTSFENENRFNIVLFLREHTNANFTEIQNALGLSSGNCAHHLNFLIEKS